MAQRWLFKTEPSAYSWADLEREGRAVWDGVKNALALKHLAAVAKGIDSGAIKSLVCVETNPLYDAPAIPSKSPRS